MRLFCSICKDIFIPASEVHVTNCGHLYHASCLGTWLQRHRTCPQCRTILAPPIRVFFDVDNEGGIDPNTLEYELDRTKDKLRETEARNKHLLERNKDFEKVVAELKKSEESLNTKNGLLKTSILALKDKVKKLLKKAEEIKSLEGEVKKWKAKADGLETLNLLMKGTAQEVSVMLESTPVTPLSVKHLCTYVAVLKGQLQKLEAKNVKLTKDNLDFMKKMDEEKVKQSMETGQMIKNLRARNMFLENELCSLKSVLKKKRERVQKLTDEVQVINPGPSTSLAMSGLGKKKSFLEIDLSDDENDNNESKRSEMSNRRGSENLISNWEALVRAGPSRMSIQPSSFTRSFNTTAGRTDEAFAYDGMGGRKKIRLGGPTPVEEFQRIKRNRKEKGLEPVCQHRNIINYCQRN